jgi:predicted dithiol-disulfide oxidoreductase (DUF899 family)
MTDHAVVTPEEWTRARVELLAREKEFTRLRDALSQARRELPWERVAKDYVFDGPRGKARFADLFAGRSQLAVYHFMFAPDWEAGCKSCSFWADNFERNAVHLAARDVTMAAVSRAPMAKIEAFKKRMGWSFDWYSSGGNDFNYDYHVSFTPEEAAKGEGYYNYGRHRHGAATDLPGISVFFRDAGRNKDGDENKNGGGAIYHTYSTFERGLDMMNAAYHYLDLVPMGRNEDPDHPMAWVRHRDSYGS